MKILRNLFSIFAVYTIFALMANGMDVPAVYVTTSSISLYWNPQTEYDIPANENLTITLIHQEQKDVQVKNFERKNQTEFHDLSNGAEYWIGIKDVIKDRLLWKALVRTAQCPEGWIGFRDSCYRRIADGVRHAEAAEACKILFPSAYLAEPRSVDEYKFITGRQILPDRIGIRVYWIGITVSSDGNATYSDGTPVSKELDQFQGADIEDDYKCIALSPTSSWDWTRTQCVVNAHFICEYPVPRPPSNIATSANEKSVTVSWDTSLHGLNNSQYIIDVREGSPENVPVSTNTLVPENGEFIFEEIKFGEVYYVSVMLEEVNGGKSAKLPDTVFISHPPSVHIEDVSADFHSLLVKWNTLQRNETTNYDNFLVKVTEIATEKTMNRSVEESRAFIFDMEPFTLYRVTVFSTVTFDTWYGNMTKESLETSPRTIETDVSPVFDLRLKEDSLRETSFAVEWQPAIGQIDFYEVEINPLAEFVETTESEYLIDGLTPGTNYDISVTTIKRGVRSYPEYLSQTTRPQALTKFQVLLSNKTVDTVSFEIAKSWADDHSFDEYDIVFKNSKNLDSVSRTFDRGSSHIMVDGLTPGSSYTVTLYTVKNDVQSFPLLLDDEVVLQVAPPENLKLLFRNETTIRLGWDGGKGDVTNYLVMCTECPGDQNKLLSANDENSLTFRDLEPGSLYNFKIQASIVHSKAPPSDWVAFSHRTRPNAPEKIEQLFSNETSQLVKWSAVEGTKDGYLIQYYMRNVDQLSTIFVENGTIFEEDPSTADIQVHIDNLVPGIAYIATVRTVSGDTNSLPAEIYFHTDANPVEGIFTVEMGEVNASIAWTPGVGGYREFELVVREVSTEERVLRKSFRNTVTTIQSLKPGTLYYVQVTNIVYESRSDVVGRNFLTRPLPVADVEVYDIGESSFSVRWVPPKSPYSEFMVILYDAKEREISRKTVSVSFVSFDGLIPGKHYALEIRSTINTTDSFGVTKEVTLFPQPPLGLISAGKTSTSLSISWVEPKGVVESYVVIWEPGEGNKTVTEKKTVTLENLNPGIAYSIEVYSRSEGNRKTSKSATKINMTTDEYFPGPVVDLTVKSFHPALTVISWKEPEQPNGIILSYTVRYTQVYPIFVEQSPITKEVISKWLTVELTNLNPGSWYVVSVVAKNSKGEGMLPVLQRVYTVESTPGPVANLSVEATKPRTLNVSWKVPREPNGEIIEYKLSVMQKNNAEIIQVADFYRDLRVHPLECVTFGRNLAEPIFSDFIPQNNTVVGPFFEATCDVDYQIKGLTPYTQYLITVEAFTAVGSGDAMSVQHTALEEAPSGPPRNVTVTQCGPTSISLSWLPPEFPNGMIYYQIELFDKGEYVTSNASFELTSLIPFSNYAVRLRSFTSAGESESTDWLLLNTTEDVPTEPLGLSGKVMNSESVYLIWHPAADPKGIISSYNVTIIEKETSELFRIDSITVDDANVTENAKAILDPNTEVNKLAFHDVSSIISSVGSKIVETSNETLTHIANDLKPYTEYMFEVGGITTAGLGMTATVTLKTAEDKPGSSPSNLSYTNLTSTSVNLTWLEPKDPNGAIISYSVMYISKISEMRTEVSNRTYVVLDNLSKNSPYSVYVNSKTSAGAGPSSDMLQMYTEEDVPESPPLDAKYFNITPAVIRLQWSPPKIPNGFIRFYTIYYRNISGELSHRSEYTTTFLTNLKVYGEYTVSIAASTKFGDGGQRSLPLYVRTGEGQPGSPPHNLSYENISSTEVSLSWCEPVEPNGIITRYEIVAESDEGQVRKLVTANASTEFSLDWLQPFSKYTISIRAHTKHGDGGQISEPMVIYTMQDAPGTPPTNIKYQNISSTEVNVSWDAPVIPNGIVTTYKILFGLDEYFSDGYSIRIENLSPYTKYNCEISASTTAGEGPSAAVTVYTEEDEPTSPPREVSYVQISSTEIRLEWLPPLIPNGKIVSYTVHYSGMNSNHTVVTNKTNVTLSELEKYSEYQATISARTKIGNGDQYSDTIKFQTLQDAPSDPPQNVGVLVTGPNSIQVTWEPPTSPNGVIQFYTIYLKEDNGNLTSEKISEGTSAVVSVLKKYTWYNVTVTGSTGLGDGNQTSKAVRIQTLPGVPDNGVQDLHVSNYTLNTLLLSWTEPLLRTGIFYYSVIVHILRNNDTFETALTYQTSETHYGISDLQPFTTYRIAVTPLVQGVDGSGPEMSIFFQTPEAAPSSPVSDLKIENVTHNSVTLSWAETPEPNGVIISHLIEIEDIYDQVVPAYVEPYVITIPDLDSQKSYNITITPMTQVGLGPKAVIIATTTSGVPEGAPRNIEVQLIQAHQVTLSWDAPYQANVDITTYDILYYQVEKDTVLPISETKILNIGAESEIMLTGLHAYSSYAVRIQAGTNLGFGPFSNVTIFTTLQDLPDPPHLVCENAKDWKVFVSWQEPFKPNGIIVSYKITYHPSENAESTVLLDADTLNYTIADVIPFSLYKIEVQASNRLGSSLPAVCSILTPESLSTVPQNLSLIVATSSRLTIEWMEPAEVNGILSHYEVSYEPGYSCLANSGDLQLETAGNQICVLKTTTSKRTLISLQSYSVYYVSVGAVTGAGLGEMTTETPFRTKTGVPDYPARNVAAYDISSTAINVTWEEPYYFAGPTSYQANAYLGNNVIAVSEVAAAGSQSIVIEGLEEDTSYTVTVSAMTSAGSIESRSTIVTTDEDAPGDPPAEIVVLTQAENSSIAFVQFTPPNDPNGPLYEYSLQYKIGKQGRVTTVRILEEDLPYHENPIIKHNVAVVSLLGGRDYYFRMNAATLTGAGPWTNWTGPITMPISAPPTPGLFEVAVPEESQSHSTTTLEVQFCVFSDVNGPLSNVTVIIAEDGGDLDLEPVNWFQAYWKNPSPPYAVLATDEYEQLCESGDGKARQKRSIKSTSGIFVIGQDRNCLQHQEPYCNGPLKSNTPYRMKLRGTAINGKSTESEYSEVVKTQPTFFQANLYLLIGLLAGFGVLIFFISVLIHYLRKRLNSRSFNDSQESHHNTLNQRLSSGVKSPSPVDNLSFVMEPTDNKGKRTITRPVAKTVFSAHVARMSGHHDKGFLSEFEEIESAQSFGTKTVGSQPFNAGKNRFTDVIPYDHYRVKIEDISSVEGSGYINASYIPGTRSPEQYIAAQSPLVQTKNEFWRMVWETGSRSLVMLCKVEQDGNENKISKYWPTLTQTNYYGNLAVQCSLEEKKTEWTIRTFIVTKRGQRRQVTQYHFNQWPHRGAPSSPQSFSRFVQVTRTGRTSEDHPTIVMCGSGSGRTAVFIAYDMIIDAMGTENHIDPCGIVSELRSYRPFMIQTVTEYSFLHRCLAHSVNAIPSTKSSVHSPTGDGVEETTMF